MRYIRFLICVACTLRAVQSRKRLSPNEWLLLLDTRCELGISGQNSGFNIITCKRVMLINLKFAFRFTAHETPKTVTWVYYKVCILTYNNIYGSIVVRKMISNCLVLTRYKYSDTHQRGKEKVFMILSCESIVLISSDSCFREKCPMYYLRVMSLRHRQWTISHGATAIDFYLMLIHFYPMDRRQLRYPKDS